MADKELQFNELELKTILNCVMKCLPKGKASGDLNIKIVKMINALKETKENYLREQDRSQEDEDIRHGDGDWEIDPNMGCH